MNYLRIIGINILIVFTYVLILFYFGYKQSGGDLFIIAMTDVLAVVHIIVLIVLKLFKKINSILFAISSVILGVFISFYLFDYLYR